VIKEKNDSPSLPTGWAWAKLGEISDIGQGGTPSTRKKEYWNGSIPWLRSGEILFNRITGSKGTITQTGLKNSPAKLLPKGTVLLAMTGEGLTRGRAAILDIEASANQSCAHIMLDPRVMKSEYLFYYFRKEYWNIRQLDKGTNQPGLNTAIIKEFNIPAAPLMEQLRIVSRVEELFARLDAGVEGLRKVKAQLKRYRQAVLKYAFEGKLTEEWRKTHKHETEPATKLLERIGRQIEINVKGKRKKSSRMDMPLNQELSEGWTCGRLEDWIYIAGRIGWRGLKAGEYTSEGPLFLSVYNLNKGIKVDFSEAQHITEERYEESPEIQLQNNDILLVKDGAGIGKIGIVEGLNTKATVNSSLLVIRGSDVFLPKFLLYFLMGPKMQEVVKMRITGSATPHLFQRDIKRFDVLIPPIAEQQKVVESIESSFSVADEVENTIKQGLRQAEALRQSILRDAFQGKLVPQDSSDEPADKLLERIREEKAKSKGKKDTNRGRKNKPKQLELSTYVK